MAVATRADHAETGGALRNLWRRVAATTGARMYSLAAGAVGLIITARVLGTEGRGFVATAVTWSMLFATLGYLSLGQVALHRATGRPPEEWLGPTLGGLLAMAVVVTLIGWVAAGGLYVATGGAAYGNVPGYVLVLGFATLPFLVWEQYGSALLTAVGRLSIYNRAEIYGRSCALVLLIVLLVAGAGVSGALIALVVGQALVAGAGIRYLVRRAGPALALDRRALREMLLSGLKLHLNAIGTFLFTSAAVLIVQAERGSSDTGAFQVAVQLMGVALIAPQAASLVIYGEVARLGPDGAWATNRRVLLVLGAFMALVAVIAAATAPTLLPLVLGDDFSKAVPVFQIFAFALVGQTFSAVMAPQWIGRGLFWQASVLTLALGLVNVAVCFPLVDAYGMKGAAYALLGVYSISLIGNGVMALWVERGVRSARAVAEQCT